jgi:hypothetical protein
MKMGSTLWLLAWLMLSASANGSLIVNIDACDCAYYDTQQRQCTATAIPAQDIDDCNYCDGTSTVRYYRQPGTKVTGQCEYATDSETKPISF